MRSLRKSAMFSEGQRTEGHFRYPGASNAITIIVDLRSEHDLKVLLKVVHADSATNMQVIGLTHRPTGFNGHGEARQIGAQASSGSQNALKPTYALRLFSTTGKHEPEARNWRNAGAANRNLR